MIMVVAATYHEFYDWCLAHGHDPHDGAAVRPALSRSRMRGLLPESVVWLPGWERFRTPEAAEAMRSEVELLELLELLVTSAKVPG